jgi:hypothetical protein
LFAYQAPGMFCRDTLLGGQVCDFEVRGWYNVCLITKLQACFAEIIYWEVRFATVRLEADIMCICLPSSRHVLQR